MKRKLTWTSIFLFIVAATLLVVVAGLVVTMQFGPAKTVTRTATFTSPIQTVLTIHVTPSSNLRDGEQVLVKVGAAKLGGRFFLSECASATDANINGCGDQLAAQPFIDTDPSGAGSITFYVKTRAATKPYNTTASQPCTDQCVFMATGGFGGTFVYAPLKFVEHKTSTVTSVPVHASLLGEPSHDAGISPSGSGWALTTAGLELTPDGGNSFALVPYPIPVLNISDVVIKGSHVLVAGVINFLPVLKSSNDVGATWKTVVLPAGSGNAGFARFVTQDGTLIGMLVTDVTPFSVAEWYTTSDGGVTWTHHSIPSGGAVTAAGGDLWLAGGPQFASLYKSADLGVTWSRVSTPFGTLNDGPALSVPGQLKNGNVVLVASGASESLAPIFWANVYVSSDLGAHWKVLARTNFVGTIGSYVAVPASVVANGVWLGGTTEQGIAVISTKGTLIRTSSMRAVYPGGWITSIMPFGNSSAWVTTVNGKCPSGKSSCREVSALIGTVNAGKTWSLVDLSRMPNVRDELNKQG
jgi:hypothetical protein